MEGGVTSYPVRGMDEELEARLERLGFELVEATWSGSTRRPVLRIRIDLPGSTPGMGVTVDQCAEVSRALEAWLDTDSRIPERYVLEVSSPGVERPLVRLKDWVRFSGESVVVKGKDLVDGAGNRVEGTLVGLADEEEAATAVVIRLPNGEEVRIPLSRVEKAHLRFEW